MGETIHYKAWVQSEQEVEKVIGIFKTQAEKDGFGYWLIDSTPEDYPSAIVFQVFEGFIPQRVKGIVYSVSNICDSINFVFGLHNGRWYLRNFTKTFAEAPAHRVVLEELGKLKTLVNQLDVEDPTGEWGKAIEF
jgi:hypothetical protein